MYQFALDSYEVDSYDVFIVEIRITIPATPIVFVLH